MVYEKDIHFNIQSFDRLFPFHILLDKQLIIESVGSSLKKIMHVNAGDFFFDHFRVFQPTSFPFTFQGILESSESVIILKSLQSPIVTLRGEWTQDESKDQVIFIGSPWFHTWGEVTEHHMTVNDFAKHDPIIDLLLLQKTQDISNQELKTLLERAHTNELIARIFEKFPALIWRARTDKLCNYFNETWLDFTGRTMEQEHGNGWVEGVHPEDLQHCMDTYTQAFDHRQPFEMEYRLRHRSGEYRWLRDFGRPFYDKQNQFTGYIGTCYDITENKLYEEQLKELIETKDRLFSIIGHDLKNPLINLVGLIEVLQRSYKTFDQPTLEMLISNLHKSATIAFDLLKNLLEWARSQRDISKFEPKEINIEKMFDEVEALLKSSAANKEISIEHLPSCDINVFADENMLKTILRNLVSNAIKFSHKNGKIKLSAACEKGEIKFRISDNGVGIDKEKLPYLFDPTKVVSTLGTSYEKGTGLGLSLCKDFIEKHQGKIWAESELGKGTDFIFTLPQQPCS